MSWLTASEGSLWHGATVKRSFQSVSPSIWSVLKKHAPKKNWTALVSDHHKNCKREETNLLNSYNECLSLQSMPTKASLQVWVFLSNDHESLPFFSEVLRNTMSAGTLWSCQSKQTQIELISRFCDNIGKRQSLFKPNGPSGQFLLYMYEATRSI